MAQAAVFDDTAGELLQPRQRFNKHFCLLIGAQIAYAGNGTRCPFQFCNNFSFFRDAGDAIKLLVAKQPTGLFALYATLATLSLLDTNSHWAVGQLSQSALMWTYS